MRVQKRAFGCRLVGLISPCWTVVFALLLLLGCFSFAGGPLVVFRPGEFLSWDTSKPIKIAIDQGPVAATPTGIVLADNATGVQLVKDMLQLWENVSTATVTFEEPGQLSKDITASDWDEDKRRLLELPSDTISVIFDADGSIHELIYGSASTVLGFGIPGRDDRSDKFYDRARLVLNGKSADLTQGKRFHSTTLHELGHTLGLDHSQASHTDRPVMYPFISGQTPSLPVLHIDDEVWFSYLHPTTDFATDYGAIRGKVTRRTTGPLQGANVVAAPAVVISSGLILERGAGHISAVSDFLVEGNGNFQLPGLPAGDYVVFIEPLDSAFTEGSGVGPFDFRFGSFPKDYYNGENESGDPDLDDVNDKVVIEVVAGGTINSIDLVSNETTNQLETLTDDDEELFIFPDGFSFPFFGEVYDSVTVNSDGSLTLEGGDSASTPRDEDRFLRGPPRIAPLFTDLDPSATMGGVSSEMENGALTFSWKGVPEFGEDSNLNTFSVTLFPNGDIQFHYEEVAITPDDENDDLIAIVGVTPGSGALGTEVDFLEQTQPLAMDADPIYEVVNGSFDLTGMDILFQAATDQVFVYFPAYRGGEEGTFTGFAVTNYADNRARLSFEALAASGNFQTYPDNPHGETLESGHQLSRLGSELFGLGFSAAQDGWVRLRSNTLDLAAFFLIGNGIDQLDGSVAFTQPSNRLYFTRLWDGVGSFPSLSGPLDAETFLGLANPNDETISLSLKLYAPDGTERGSAVSRQLPPLGYLWESLSSLFDAGVVADGYVAIDSADLGAIGFGLIEMGETLLGFNAVSSNSETELYSAQLAHGGASGFSFFTSIKLVNTDVSARSVRLTASNQEGGEIGQRTVRLDSGHSFQGQAGEMFSWGSADQEPVVVGSVQVEADGPGVVGDVVFGEPTAMKYAAALPLQSRLLTRAIFSHVANGRGATPAANLFTGLAFYNPGQSEVEITIKVFSPDFVLTGETKLTLGPNKRVSEILHAMIPASLGQNGGYIEVTSTAPVVAQQLFGNEALDYLSAVPPNIIQ